MCLWMSIQISGVSSVEKAWKTGVIMQQLAGHLKDLKMASKDVI